MLSGARVWEAHRDHYYQRMVQLGLGHRSTALTEYAVMAACSIAGLWAMTLDSSGQQQVVAAAGVMYLAAIIIIERAWRAKPHA
jgi:hypothetical protein